MLVPDAARVRRIIVGGLVASIAATMVLAALLRTPPEIQELGAVLASADAAEGEDGVSGDVVRDVDHADMNCKDTLWVPSPAEAKQLRPDVVILRSRAVETSTIREDGVLVAPGDPSNHLPHRRILN